MSCLATSWDKGIAVRYKSDYKLCRFRLERDGPLMRREAWAKGKQVSGVGNPSIVKERQVIASPALLPAAEWAETPGGPNGLVLFTERQKLVSTQ
jgi:hypothetical protein